MFSFLAVKVKSKTEIIAFKRPLMCVILKSVFFFSKTKLCSKSGQNEAVDLYDNPTEPLLLQFGDIEEHPKIMIPFLFQMCIQMAKFLLCFYAFLGIRWEKVSGWGCEMAPDCLCTMQANNVLQLCCKTHRWWHFWELLTGPRRLTVTDGKWEACCQGIKKKVRRKVRECVVVVLKQRQQQQQSLCFSPEFLAAAWWADSVLLLFCFFFLRGWGFRAWERETWYSEVRGQEVLSVLTWNECCGNNRERKHTVYRKEILGTKCAQRGFIKVRYSFKNTIKKWWRSVQHAWPHCTETYPTTPLSHAVMSALLGELASLWLCWWRRGKAWARCSSHRPRQWDPPSPPVSGDMWDQSGSN